MKCLFAFGAVLAGLLALPSTAEAGREFKPPSGIKVASGESFDIYVEKKEEKPASANSTLFIYEAVIVVHKTRRGRQQQIHRVEARDADLLNPKHWEIADLDGDGLEDYRVVKHVTKGGCQFWEAMRWKADRERFTNGGMEFGRYVDAKGKPVASCAMR